MRVLGEICLLTSLITTGYAAFLSVWRGRDPHRWAERVATSAGVVGLSALTTTMAILLWALLTRDFRFEYVAQYASRLLPWYYAASALWVGQAGSLLLWAWMMNVVALLLRIVPAADAQLRNIAFGLMMAGVCFLVIVMVFAADPMARSLFVGEEGAGLSPLLQHPSMLIHPPVVFLAYSAWAMPCALALAALINGRLDATWSRMARPWALAAWTLLGAGLLLGAHWAYQELGWGGYWGWDPVENGSLLPWLTGTALIHSLMVWRHRDGLKRTALMLAIITFALCNFATFLTRSGIFSSVHAFSESPIGWLFLGLMSVLVIGGIALLVRRWEVLRSEPLSSSSWSRETLVCVSIFLLLSLSVVVIVGTLVAPLSKMFTGRMIEVGPEFYNNVLPPVGLGLLAMTAVVPLLRWGAGPTSSARRFLLICFLISMVVGLAAVIAGQRQPLALVVIGLAALAVTSLLASCLHESWRRDTRPRWHGFISTLRNGRRKYAAYCIHLGFVCVAIGVTGSSFGTRQQDVTLDEGEIIDWQGRRVQYVRLEQHELPDKLVAEAVLEVAWHHGQSAPTIELRPARHLHLLQNEWTTEVAIHSTWTGDFYTILHAGLGDGQIALTLVYNPLVRWIWFGGWLTILSALVAMWPSRRRQAASHVAPNRSAKTSDHHHDEENRASAA